MAGVLAPSPSSEPSAHASAAAASGSVNLSTLQDRCVSFLLHGLATSTRKSYASAQRKFYEFCVQAGKLQANGSPCPADEWTLCLFATFLAYSLRAASIKVYLSAVRSLHIEHGFPEPLLNCPRLQRVVRGIKRLQGSASSAQLPVTDSIMLVIFNSLDLTLPDHCMFWAACTLAYFGFLRASEFTVSSNNSFSPPYHLTLQDLALDSLSSPETLHLHIKASKTDPFRKGSFIHIGRGKYPLCAIQAVVSYLTVRGAGPGHLFRLQSGQPLSRQHLTSWLRQIVASAGLPGNFSSHSFRIGAATVAARQGIPDHLIQALGRWTSNAYQLYIRTPSAALAGLSSQLSGGPPTAVHRIQPT